MRKKKIETFAVIIYSCGCGYGNVLHRLGMVSNGIMEGGAIEVGELVVEEHGCISVCCRLLKHYRTIFTEDYR